jgi:hypothetical protein
MYSSASLACPYEFDEDTRVCWNTTRNGSMAFSMIEYDHGYHNFYDGVRHGIENCSLIYLTRPSIHTRLLLLS